MNKVLFSSASDDWATPTELFESLNSVYHFTLDPCASELNHKCSRYFTKEDNGLLQSWEHENVFCNPPYGRSIRDWVRKSYESALNHGSLVVMLIPARTDTSYFHDYIYHKPNVEVTFLRGRLHFNNSKTPAPFPSMLVVFYPKCCDNV